jgi:hypothetical protein
MPVWLMFLRQWTVDMVEWKAEGFKKQRKMTRIKVLLTTVTATNECLTKK